MRVLRRGDRVRVVASPAQSDVADVLIGRIGAVGDFDGYGGISVEFNNGDYWRFDRHELRALPRRKRSKK